jgi:hypothetical protein
MNREFDTFLETFFDRRSDKVDYGTSGLAEQGSSLAIPY